MSGRRRCRVRNAHSLGIARTESIGQLSAKVVASVRAATTVCRNLKSWFQTLIFVLFGCLQCKSHAIVFTRLAASHRRQCLRVSPTPSASRETSRCVIASRVKCNRIHPSNLCNNVEYRSTGDVITGYREVSFSSRISTYPSPPSTSLVRRSRTIPPSAADSAPR